MRKLNAIICRRSSFILLIALLLIGCATSPSIMTKRDTVITEDTLIDRAYGFQLSKPGSNWYFAAYEVPIDSFSRGKNVMSTLAIVKPKKDLDYGASFIVSIYIHPVENLESFNNKVHFDSKPAKVGKKNIAGQPADYWTTKLLKTTIVENFQFVHGNHGFLLSRTYGENKLKEYIGLWEDLEYILNSFKFTK